ncbi:hypothetical protein CBR_g30817 [Chara braunii]|uniref:Uncharacterized protein n=1 Tax=Chara braunii TaxID=69332 RepID=A0A388JXK0_CHABU|nr:hypothetical protein CBR_g30817 [Chara braunii]|eukprot:GBG62498.1 hypothetical protein CBR_g30817 [Chara braunii]
MCCRIEVSIPGFDSGTQQPGTRGCERNGCFWRKLGGADSIPEQQQPQAGMSSATSQAGIQVTCASY